MLTAEQADHWRGIPVDQCRNTLAIQPNLPAAKDSLNSCSQHLGWISGLVKTLHGRTQIQLSVATNERLIGFCQTWQHRSTSCPVVTGDQPRKLNMHREMSKPTPTTATATLCRRTVLTRLAGGLGQEICKRGSSS